MNVLSENRTPKTRNHVDTGMSKKKGTNEEKMRL